MGKVILVNSPLYRFPTKNEEDYLPPLGLIYIATYLEENDVEVELLDSIEKKFGVEEVIHYINRSNVSHMGINIFTINYDLVKEICEGINYGIHVIIGGNLTKFKYIDISKWNRSNLSIIIGEGEKVSLDLIKSVNKPKPRYVINGVATYLIDENSKYYISHLDELNINRDFIDGKYINHYNAEEASIITSRGCSYNCAYCGSARSINEKISVRTRSLKNIRDELLQVSLNKEVKYIRVLDDLFLRNRKSITQAIELFNEFDQFKWRAMAHVLSFRNSLDILCELKESGCKELFIGIESGSQKIRNYINKDGTINDVINVIESILDSGISVKGYFIVGFPTETIDQMKETYELAKYLMKYSKKSHGDFRVSVFKFRPYHGTILYRDIMLHRKSDIITKHISINTERNQFNFSSGNYSNAEDDELEDIYNKIRELN